MKIVHSASHRAHAPPHELDGGRFVPARETPQRVDLILAEIDARKLGPIVGPESCGHAALAAVHTSDYLDFLASAWTRWTARHGPQAPPALPSVWPRHPVRESDLSNIEAAIGARTSDAGTPIVAGTWSAVSTSADAAMTAARLVAGGERTAFALTRPPGHHAAAGGYAGYCFLNNAAIAAQSFVERGARVAILDVDVHHGDGTQSIFWERGDVLTVSLHGDPRELYPHFTGHADERGVGAGAGANVNLPLPIGSAWDVYGPALAEAARAVTAFGADVLVVALGVDTHDGDPLGGLRLTGADYLRMGEALARVRVPTLFTMEGGYRLDVLGTAVCDVLAGFESA
jgi:acetoin utilization deacetylase AcuC-like enzyme